MPLAHVTARSAISAAGAGCDALAAALQSARSGLRPNDFEAAPVPGWVGRVDGVEGWTLPAPLLPFDCRNHRLADMALQADGFAAAVAAACGRYGASRVAVVVGTSTAGILSTEAAYRQRDAAGALPAWFDYRHVHRYAALPEFVRQRLGLAGLVQCVSTACSSSAKVFGVAARWLAAGLCDAAVVGGVDSLCGTTLHGFASLQLLSPRPCAPFDVDRSGVTIGEGAAFALLEREPGGTQRRRTVLLGCGDSADAHHMSAPDPLGRGAADAMRAALSASGVDPDDIDCVFAHGTATRINDAVEASAIAGVLGEGARVTSTKGCTGHTLGAAGALSAVAALLCIERGMLPGTVNIRQVDPALQVDVVTATREVAVQRLLVNAFGFGGNNSALVLGAAA